MPDQPPQADDAGSARPEDDPREPEQVPSDEELEESIAAYIQEMNEMYEGDPDFDADVYPEEWLTDYEDDYPDFYEDDEARREQDEIDRYLTGMGDDEDD